MFRAIQKEKTIMNLYKFHELPEDAKETARDEFIKRYSENICLSEETRALAEVERLFDVRFSYNFDAYGVYYKGVKYTAETYHEEETALEGLRMRTWLINNYYKYMYMPKRYNIKGNWNKKRYSKIKKEWDGCHLSGLYLDDDLLKPVIEFIKNPRKKLHYNYLDLMEEVLEVFIEECQNEYRYRMTDDYITDTAECLNMLFGENGELYHEIDLLGFDLEAV